MKNRRSKDNNKQMTSEQQDIVRKIKNYNIVVDCVVGSGKSTTVLLMAKEYPQYKILLLTYNKRLRMETMEKAQIKVGLDGKTGLDNIEIHTFHSYYVKYYDKLCCTDNGILNTLNGIDNKIPISPIQNYDIIVIDEAQDLNHIYYKAVMNIINNNVPNTKQSKHTKICIIGDKNQSIYDYNGSDARYITFADKLFNPVSEKENKTKRTWLHLKLSKTFRCTDNVCKFINNNLSGPKIETDKTGSKIRYVICNHYGSRPYEEILYYTNVLKIPIDEIFILAPSVKNSGTPVRALVNRLSSKGFPIYCPSSDTERLDSDITKGKLVFCTFHQSKGLERRVVIVFNFDISYTEFYKKNNIHELSNELYVALTRSSQHLSLFHHYTNNFLPFMNFKLMNNYCHVEGIEDLKLKKENNNNSVSKMYSVTDLLRHLSGTVVNEIMKLIEITVLNEPEDKINIPIKIAQYYNDSVYYENVSEITGVAIPAYYEYKTTGKITIIEDIENETHNKKNKQRGPNSKTRNEDNINLLEGIKRSKEPLPMFRNDSDSDNDGDGDSNNDSNGDSNSDSNKAAETLTPSKILYMSNKWLSLNNGYLHKINQINEYNWLNIDILNKCVNRLSMWIEPNAVYEVPYSKVYGSRMISGFIDCISNNNVYEFKCVETLEHTHYIQLVLYEFLAGSEYNYFLFNIVDNSCYRVYSSTENINKILDILIDYKTIGLEKLNDELFLKSALNSY